MRASIPASLRVCTVASRPCIVASLSTRARARSRSSSGSISASVARAISSSIPLVRSSCQRPRREPASRLLRANEHRGVRLVVHEAHLGHAVQHSLRDVVPTALPQPVLQLLSAAWCHGRWRRTIWRATSCGSGSPSRWWRSCSGSPGAGACQDDPGLGEPGLDGVGRGDVELGDVELGDVAARAASSAALAASCLSFMSSRTRRGPRPPGLPACRPADRPRASP